MSYNDMTLEQLFSAADNIFNNNDIYEDESFVPEADQVIALQDIHGNPFNFDFCSDDDLFEVEIAPCVLEYLAASNTVKTLRSWLKNNYNRVVPSKWRKAQVVQFYATMMLHGGDYNDYGLIA